MVQPAVRLACALALATLLFIPGSRSLGQSTTPCGLVNQIDYPIDISDTLERRFDDFGRYRNRFGGLHTGIDIGFRRPGESVRAAARGRVTYANPEGWDTEKGVVIVEHSFPDGSRFYSLYGHMEETETVKFPPVGSCVERGQVVGVIGRPTLSLPHLHYEIRDFLPNDGGPGYVAGNPRLQGWFHPFDFTELWRARLAGVVVASITLNDAPDLPPVLLDSGVIASVSDGVLTATIPPANTLWRLSAGGDLIRLATLPGDRLITQARGGDVRVLQGGRYAAAWTVDGPNVPLVTLGDTLLFARDGAGLAAYDSNGTSLWLAPGETAARVLALAANGETAALTTAGSVRYGLRVVNERGDILYEDSFARQPLLAPGPSGSWYALDGVTLYRIEQGERETLGTIDVTPGSGAALTVDPLGQSYIYLDDRDGTLLALGTDGVERWRVSYPASNTAEPPLMDTGNGCLLYTLDGGGRLNVFSASDGDLLRQVAFYAGGERTGHPEARPLEADALEQVLVGAGFLSVALLDGHRLAPAAAC